MVCRGDPSGLATCDDKELCKPYRHKGVVFYWIDGTYASRLSVYLEGERYFR